MINIDAVSLTIQIINFIFLVWILNLILYRPIRKILIQRKEKIDGLEQGIKSGINDAREKETAFTTGIRSARADGMKKKEALLDVAAQEEKNILNRISEKAQADLAEAKAQITAEADTVRASLAAELDVFANAICEKILGRAI